MAVGKKIYILDTNVLVHDPQALFKFENTLIGIPATVLEELDSFKSEGTERGRNAREAIRQLDLLRTRGSLGKGVTLDNGSILQVIFYNENMLKQNYPLILRPGDNEIVLTAFSLLEDNYDVIFISKDINARVKADALGIKTEDYAKDQITMKEFYQGWIHIEIPSVELKQEFPAILPELARNNEIKINEFVIIESQNNPQNYKIFRYYGEEQFKQVKHPDLTWRMNARNIQQLMALDLLLDHTIQFVCLFGPAGTGKTFLALLAALHEVFVSHHYERILISRPIMPLGKDIGYLPGTVEEKLHSWMLPIYDNMEYISHMINTGGRIEQNDTRPRDKKKGKWNKPKKHDSISIDHLIAENKIGLEAITYMRGRSIPYQYIIIDEAQNLTPHEVKTLITRAGEGSKIILTGDPYQIDSPYLDFGSNGLVVASEHFKGQKLFGSIFLNISERSELSKLASELL